MLPVLRELLVRGRRQKVSHIKVRSRPAGRGPCLELSWNQGGCTPEGGAVPGLGALHQRQQPPPGVAGTDATSLI